MNAAVAKWGRDRPGQTFYCDCGGLVACKGYAVKPHHMRGCRLMAARRLRDLNVALVLCVVFS